MTDIYVPDIECDSCVKLISKRLHKEKINNFKMTNECVQLENDDQTQKAIKIIKGLGYRAGTDPFERKTWNERVKHFKENKKQYAIEVLGLQNTIGVFIVLLAISAFSYIVLLKNVPNFLNNYGVWIFYLIITITSLGMGLWHFYAYRAKVTCMTGMMIGMTFGMQGGMMLGAIVGATNGFFMGAMAGMIIGTIIGIFTGKCCGVMGVMEGAMAGLMGGTMGPMITVMMFSDHVNIFMPFYMAINVFIMLGLSYMLYEEVVEGQVVKRRPLDFTTLAAASILALILIGALMIFGPSSALISF